MKNPKFSQKRIFHRSEPVAYFLLETLRLSPFSFGLLSIVFFVGLYLFVAWVSNTLWSKPGQMGLLQDWLPWVWVLVINPVVLGYYVWSFQAIDHVIQDLETSNVVETENSAIDRLTHRLYDQRWRRFFALACAAGFGSFFFFTRSGLKNSWTGSGPLPILLTTLVTLIVVYMGAVLVLNLITNVRILHHILGEKELNVNPLHPDRCGGLRSLSDYSLKTAYLAALLGIMVGLVEYQFITEHVERIYWFVHLLIPLHIALSIACFFGPLLAAHQGMKRAKEELLNKIAQQFQVDYFQMHTNLHGEADSLKKGTEKIKELRAFYTMTEEFPVWPFDVQTFRRFLLTIPTPLLPLLPKLIGVLLKKWGIEIG